MQLFKTITLTAAALALVACSSKAKKPQTTQTTKTSTPTKTATDTSSSKTDLDKNEATPDTPPAAKADLGQVIFFEFDSSTLADDARGTLDNNAKWLKENAARTLLIEGHTDETGTAEYNLGLGQRRAQAARAYLVRMGVDKARIKIITFGEERPASKTDSQNRRSVFVATKKKK